LAVTVLFVGAVALVLVIAWDVAIAERLSDRRCFVYREQSDLAGDVDGVAVSPDSGGSCLESFDCSAELQVVHRVFSADRGERWTNPTGC
jgi:hypothetical protein